MDGDARLPTPESQGQRPTPLSPPSSLRQGYDQQADPAQRLFQGPPVRSNFLSVRKRSMKLQFTPPVLILFFTLSAIAQEPVSTEELRDRFLAWKFGMFISFNVGTFHDREWATGYEDPAAFTPDKLDCSQWVEAAAAVGMKYAVLTVKHTGGWCLWDSEYTETHDMTAFVNYKGGKGDIVREFVDACRKQKIKVGLYYLLNVAPDQSGLLPQYSLERLQEVGELLGVGSP
jgi:hypothetical protein